MERTEVIDKALGHSWGEWTVTKEPSYSAEGEKQRICSRDPSHIETEMIPALKPADKTDEGTSKTGSASHTPADTGDENRKLLYTSELILSAGIFVAALFCHRRYAGHN